MANRFKEMRKADSKAPVQSAYDIAETEKITEENLEKSNPTDVIPESEKTPETSSGNRELIVEPIALRGLVCTRVDISDEIYANFKYYSKINGYSQYQLTNALLENDIKWTAAHPEFPSQDFVKECILKSRKKWHNLEGRTAVSLYCTEECKEHLKKMCAKTCMTTYQYFEYLINQYINV